MKFHSRSHHGGWISLATLLVACQTDPTAVPVLEGMTPEEAWLGQSVPVTITGQGFQPRMWVSYGTSGPSELDADFTASIGVAELVEVVLVSDTTLEAVVPSTLATGVYALVVVDPRGREVTLPEAFTVKGCSPEEADGDNDGHDSLACGGDDCDDGSALCTTSCVDLDGDSIYDCRDDCVNVDGACDPVLEDLHAQATTISGTDLTASVDITPAVDASRSVLFFNLAHDSKEPEDGAITGQLAADGGSVVFERAGVGEQPLIDIEWSVVQLTDVTVQRGMATIPGGTVFADVVSVTLDQTVDPARSFLLSSIRSTGGRYSWNDWALATLQDDSTLAFRRGDAGFSTQVEWQLVEISAPAVLAQHGEETLEAGQDSASVILPTVAPLDHSFLSFSHVLASSQTDPSAADHVLRGRLISENELSFDRDSSALGAVVGWSVVTWNALTTEHGNATFAGGDQEQAITLARPVDPASALSFITGGMREGKTTHALDDGVGTAWFTTALTAGGTTLRVYRGDGRGQADAAWTVIEFR